jgi:hypothetical protein
MTDSYTTLSEELHNNIITFVDGFGETVATFDFVEKKPYIVGNITNDKETKLIIKTKKSKYNKMLNIHNDYYYGDYNQNNKNIMGKFFKIIVPTDIFGAKNEYILLIIDNPYYNNESEDIAYKGRYKLIIYKICNQGIYIKSLIEL